MEERGSLTAAERLSIASRGWDAALGAIIGPFVFLLSIYLGALALMWCDRHGMSAVQSGLSFLAGVSICATAVVLCARRFWDSAFVVQAFLGGFAVGLMLNGILGVLLLVTG